jgi:hypothetical protein
VVFFAAGILLHKGVYSMPNVKRTGIYQNTGKYRWEFWYVGSSHLKVLVSWLSWTASNQYDEWERNCLLKHDA